MKKTLLKSKLHRINVTQVEIDYDGSCAVDKEFLDTARQIVGQTYYDVDIYVLDCNLEVPGSRRTYPRCLLVGLSDIDGDASSGAPSAFSLTFAVSQLAPVGVV